MVEDVGHQAGAKSSEMRIVWSRRAIRHLTHLRDSIARDSEQNAALIARRILEAIDLLHSHPEMGRPGRLTGTRELVVPGTPYIVPYRVRANGLDLIAILHGRQKWPAEL